MESQRSGPPDRPVFHVCPSEGWLNDPNGPMLFNGAYHMFFQHLPGSSAWGFGLVWGHAVSQDLVHWELLPHAIIPTPGSVDSAGCFSGCAALDDNNMPTLLYTGVRMRGQADAGPLPPKESDLGLPFIETQLLVHAEDPIGDWRLAHWKKAPLPIISLPPPNLNLAGWRDPYLIGPPVCHPEMGWRMLLGSGIKAQGGTVPVYHSKRLDGGWTLVGELCSGRHEDGTGIVWECPLLAELPEVPGYQGAGSAGPAGASASAAGGTGSGPLQASRSMAQRSGSMARGGGGGGAAAGEGGGQQRGELQRQTTGRRRGAGAGPAPASTSQDQQQQQGDGAGGTAGQQQQQPRGDGGPAAGATGISGAAAGSGSASGAPKYPRRFFFCLSPDACTNPTLYYLGPFIPHSDQAALREAVKAGLTTTRPDGPAIKDPPGGQLCGKFLIREAVGPFRLDLGDILYAPNTLLDPDNGRVLLWAWLQEARKVAGTWTYAGCLSLPRELWLDSTTKGPSNPQLVQRLPKEVANLRSSSRCWVFTDPSSRDYLSRSTLATLSKRDKEGTQQTVAADATAIAEAKAAGGGAAAVKAGKVAAGTPGKGGRGGAGRDGVRGGGDMEGREWCWDGVCERIKAMPEFSASTPAGGVPDEPEIQVLHVTADGESSEELHPPTALLDNSSTGSSDDDAETYGPGADMSTNGPVDPSSAGRAAEGPDGNNSKATGEEPLILGPGEAFPLPSFLDGTHLDIELVMRFCPEPGGAGLDQLLQQGLGDGGGGSGAYNGPTYGEEREEAGQGQEITGELPTAPHSFNMSQTESWTNLMAQRAAARLAEGDELERRQYGYGDTEDEEGEPGDWQEENEDMFDDVHSESWMLPGAASPRPTRPGTPTSSLGSNEGRLIPGREPGDGGYPVPPPPHGACCGLVLRAWQAGAEGAAAILYDFNTHVLEVVFEALDPVTHEFSLAAPGCRRVGGRLQRPPPPGAPIELRVVVDFSVVEVFTGGGEVLSTRVYRGVNPEGSGPGIDLVSIGAATQVLHVGAWEMKSAWITHAGPPKAHLALMDPSPSLPAEQVPAPVAGSAAADSKASSTRAASGSGSDGQGAEGSAEDSKEGREATARASSGTSAGSSSTSAGTGVPSTQNLLPAVPAQDAPVQAPPGVPPSRSPAASPRAVTGRRSSEGQRAGGAPRAGQSDAAALMAAFTELQVQ